MRANVRHGYDRFYGCDYSYALPSRGRYQWQWFWDSCFHAIALSRIDVEMAKRELHTLLIPQRADGFLGHITFWGCGFPLRRMFGGQQRLREWRLRNTGMLQPPVLAQALLSVWRASGDDSFLAELLPKVRAWHDWLARERDALNDGLIGVISPYESGMDNSPAYDAALGLHRPGRRGLLFKNWLLDWHNSIRGRGHDYREALRRDRLVMIDPFMNAVYADGWDALSELHDHLGESELASSAASRSALTLNALNDQCWDESSARWLFLRGHERIPERTLTVASIFPLIIGGMDRERVSRVLEKQLLHPDHFWTTYPVPSVAASEPTFDPDGESTIWRGPVCLNLNWLLARGLRGHGFDDVAHKLESKSVAMASREFREFYSPLSGKGLRGLNFGWATIAVDMPTVSIIA